MKIPILGASGVGGHRGGKNAVAQSLAALLRTLNILFANRLFAIV
jgi:hypothetical protein